jgi:hypothetical protein
MNIGNRILFLVASGLSALVGGCAGQTEPVASMDSIATVIVSEYRLDRAGSRASGGLTVGFPGDALSGVDGVPALFAVIPAGSPWADETKIQSALSKMGTLNSVSSSRPVLVGAKPAEIWSGCASFPAQEVAPCGVAFTPRFADGGKFVDVDFGVKDSGSSSKISSGHARVEMGGAILVIDGDAARDRGIVLTVIQIRPGNEPYKGLVQQAANP